MMDKEGLIELLVSGLKEFENAPMRNFADHVKGNGRPIKSDLDRAGVYAIYEGDGCIYVGCTGKNKRTLGDRIANLFFVDKQEKASKHTRSNKLLRRFGSIESVRQYYLKECKFKAVKTENILEACFLESALILMLLPIWNEK